MQAQYKTEVWVEYFKMVYFEILPYGTKFWLENFDE